MNVRRVLLVAILWAVFSAGSATDASACGGPGQVPCFPFVCDVFVPGGCAPLIGCWSGFCSVGHYDLTRPQCNAPNQFILGLCWPCGAHGQPSCPSGGCNVGTQNVLGICFNCGHAGQPACNGECFGTTQNVLGICQECGGAGQLVCPDSGGCDSDRFNNIAGICTGCGRNFAPFCFQGAACDAGFSVVAGLCAPIPCGGPGEVTCVTGPMCDTDRLNPIPPIPSVGVCTPCGGEGQLLCVSGALCDPGLNVVAGLCLPLECGGENQITCATGPMCDSDRFNPIPPIPALGACIPCGRNGLPVCALGRACDRFQAQATALCLPIGSQAEPSVNADAPVLPAASPDAEIFGFADIHAHTFANLGFGGLLFWGAPFDWDGITYALPWCDFTQEFGAVGPNFVPINPLPFLGVPVHGPFHTLDLIGLAAGQPLLMSNQGGSSLRDWAGILDEGNYDGYPHWKNVNHQQQYYKWIERSFLGGQRLMVMLAVTNFPLCQISNRRAGDGPLGFLDQFLCFEMEAVERQIAAAKEMQTYVDSLNGGDGWFKIAYSAQQARQIINSGKMAVVLGTEIASLFGCQYGLCTEADVDREVDRLYALGVRHVFPVHVYDNDFGGAALAHKEVAIGNVAASGHFFESYDCAADGYEFSLNFLDPLSQALAAVFGRPPDSTHQADCNVRGLTPLGRRLFARLMAKGMIIDVDHLSLRALRDALDIFEAQGYPGVSAGHVRFFDVVRGGNRTESVKRPEDLARIRDLGGIVAPILAPTDGENTSGYGLIPNDCAGSSKQWVQQYQYGLDHMRGGPHDLPAVAFGSDFNGFLRHLGPRFGGDACLGEAHGAQANPVVYPFEAFGRPGTRFFKQRTGDKQFDFNFDGLAHTGLLPDLIEDLRRNGLSDADLAPLFRSAEAYVSMWGWSEGRGTPAPTTEYEISPAPNHNGWNNSAVTVALRGLSRPGGTRIRRVRFSVGGAALQTILGQSAEVQVAQEGTTDINFSVEDMAGHITNGSVVRVQIDMTPPTAEAQLSEPANGHGWHRQAVVVTFSGADELSGLDTCDAAVSLSGEGAGQSASGTCADMAGNAATATSPAVNIDLTAPHISGTRMPAANAHGWNNADVTVSFACSDALSGLAAGSPPVDTIVSGEGAGQSVARTCSDVAGNTAASDLSGISIDKTPPAIAGAAARSPDSNGWYNHSVDVNWTCTDALSGVDTCSPTATYGGPDSASAMVSGSATDKAGNSAGDSVGLRFDGTPPIIVLTTPPDGATYRLNQPISASYSCGDNLAGVGACAGPVANGANLDTATVGRKEFRVNASDVAGNHASLAHGYDVHYVFEGFFQPVDNLPIVNVANAGRTVPLKWRLTDAGGALIADPGSFLSLLSTPIACDASPSVTLEEEIVALDATVLKFTGTDWHYNWKTSSGWSGCRLLHLTLSDGTQHLARFEFR